MTVRPITIVGHRALSQRTRPIREVTDELRTLVADMFETNDAASGAGLAAPQVGARRRLFIYSCEDADGTLQRGVVLNPVLQRFGGIALDEETLEGCLSVPGEGFPTARHRGARVTGTDLEGAEVIVEDEGGVLSRALQHEVDHLDGSLFLDRLTPARRREALDAVKNRGWRTRRTLAWDPSAMDAADV
ncbi:MAG: peptide deformylase [Brachybacterium sp.]|uniref:peptide deformylase n=1 Tax=Brachybacterium sp. TaxID=1891286 RepID=UPI002654273E|nr:peptide deformylase [Brachybacterium sp.]